MLKTKLQFLIKVYDGKEIRLVIPTRLNPVM